jgi:hypothetical protein
MAPTISVCVEIEWALLDKLTPGERRRCENDEEL